MPKAKDRRRIQFDVFPKTLEEIDQIGAKMGCATRSETIRKSIQMVLVIINKLAEGYSLELVKEREDGSKETISVIVL